MTLGRSHETEGKRLCLNKTGTGHVLSMKEEVRKRGGFSLWYAPPGQEIESRGSFWRRRGDRARGSQRTSNLNTGSRFTAHVRKKVLDLQRINNPAALPKGGVRAPQNDISGWKHKLLGTGVNVRFLSWEKT